jgi:hypothetical protein
MHVKVTNLRRWRRRAIWRGRLSARPALRLPDHCDADVPNAFEPMLFLTPPILSRLRERRYLRAAQRHQGDRGRDEHEDGSAGK